MHEFLHALGFYHMQSSFDRDDYVSIDWNSIQENKESNFRKYNNTIVTNFNVTYDYESVLHYGAYAFSKNGLPTIIPLVIFAFIYLELKILFISFYSIQNSSYISVIGQRLRLTSSDIKKLNIMYECDKI